MKCVICRWRETVPGTTTVTLERDALTFVVKGVPARVCPNCGEDYVDEETARNLLATAERLAEAGSLLEVRQYAA